MNTLITTHWISVDGYVAGPEGEMDWILADQDMERYEIDLVESADALLLGRGTYEDFSGYWPAVAADRTAPAGQRAYASRLDELHKIVASRSTRRTLWDDTTFFQEIRETTIAEAKQGKGRIVTYGSVGVVQELARRRLVDEFHLLCHPVALGSGTALFDERVDLALVRSETFASGVVLNVYRPAWPEA